MLPPTEHAVLLDNIIKAPIAVGISFTIINAVDKVSIILEILAIHAAYIRPWAYCSHVEILKDMAAAGLLRDRVQAKEVSSEEEVTV